MQLNHVFLRRIFLVALVAATSSACVSTNSSSGSQLVADSITPMRILPESSFQTLATAQAGEQLILPESPWGDSVQALVRDRYLSASNRTCLALAIARAPESEPALVCRNEAQQWYQSRVLVN